MSNKNFKEDDLLGRDDFCKSLTEEILKGYEYKNEHSSGYTVSLHGDYGIGKTWFLQMWKDYLLSGKHKSNDTTQEYEATYLDLYKDEYYKDPLISFSYCLLEVNKKNTDLKKVLIDIIKSSAKTTFEKHTGINLSNKICQKENDIFEDYKKYKELIEKVKEEIKNKNQVSNKPSFILVDELDRVNPSYALKALERLKHFFDIPGIIFVFALNKTQLEISIKHHYGKCMEFEGYYRRFFNLQKNLKLSSEDYKRFAEELYHNVVNIKEHIISRQHDVLIQWISAFFEILKFSLRDIDRLFRELKYYIKDKKVGRHTDNFFILIFILSIKIKRTDLEFQQLGEIYEMYALKTTGNKNYRSQSLKKFCEKVGGNKNEFFDLIITSNAPHQGYIYYKTISTHMPPIIY